jgi:hypothetical protein
MRKLIGLGLALAALFPAAALAQEDDGGELKVELEGFYRARLYHFTNLYTPADGDPRDHARYATHKLQLRPAISYDSRAKFIFEVNALDQVVWGDNQSLASTAIFAGGPSNTGIDGEPVEQVKLSRAWVEFSLPVGLLRVGRQPSNWGLGLLANDGNGIGDEFGEHNYGNSFDRIVFATKPIAIAQTLAGKTASNIPLFFAFGADRLVEDPLTQYYGYKCDDDPLEEDDARCLDDEDHSWTEDRESDQRDDGWWAEPEDDVFELIYVLIYRGEDLQVGDELMDLTAGAYAINRRQAESSSNVWIFDAYLDASYRKFFLTGEALTIRGATEGITLSGAVNRDEGASPLYKQAAIWGAVLRGGYETPDLTAQVELGIAAGDPNIADERLLGRPLHPDHNVGLLLYEEVLSRVTEYTWGDAASGLWSQGGVYNSSYIYPMVKYRPFDWAEVVAAYLVAFPHAPDGAIIRDDDYSGYSDGAPRILGQEFDLALRMRLVPHVHWSVEGGIAQVTERLPTDFMGLTKDGRVWTVQTRLAYVF